MMGRLIQPTNGAFTEQPSESMYDIRKSVFVDNSLHLAKYTEQNNALPKATIGKTNYSLSSQKQYSATEEDSSLVLKHSKTDGHSLETKLWSPKGLNTIPRVLYDGLDYTKRLYRDKISVLSKGLRLELPNMENNTFENLELTNSFYVGQPVDVGFRTSDLAMELSSSLDGVVSSVSVGEPLNPTNAYSQRRRHSKSFSAFNFDNFNLLVALKLLTRKDNRVLYYDNFGNVLFLPFNYSKHNHYVYADARLGSRNENPIDDTPNRITLKGKPLALNDESIVTLNDAERQQGRFNDDVIENTTPIVDMTLIGISEVTKAARQILKANNLLKESIETNGHMDVWFLRPGDVVNYGGKKLVVMEIQHKLTDRTSDIQMLSLQAGVENLFQSIDESAIAKVDVQAENLNNQIIKENLNFFDEIKITTSVNVITNIVDEDKIILGGNANRISLGASAKTIGINKSGIILQRGDE